MTTATIERHGTSLLGWLILLGLAGAVLMALGAGMAGDVTVSPHAEERHGSPASMEAARYLQNGGQYNRSPCRNGNELWTFRYGGRDWLAIVHGNRIITLFEATKEYLHSIRERDGCGETWQLGSHDWPSMAAGQ